MKFNLSIIVLDTNLPLIIGCVCAAAVVLIAIIAALLYVLVFKKKKYVRELKKLSDIFDKTNKILTGKINQNMQRLEVISRTNLNYSDSYSSCSKDYKYLLEELRIQITNRFDSFNDFIKNKDFKNYKLEIKQFEDQVDSFVNSVNILDNQVSKLIKPEEDCRQKMLELKEKFRETKSNYNNNADILGRISNSFSITFEGLDEKFEQVDNLIDKANYNDVNALFPKLENSITELNKIIDKAPNIIKAVYDELPKKGNDLSEKYEQLIKEGYPIEFLNVNQRLNSVQKKLEKLKNDLNSLYIDNSEQEIGEIKNEFNDLNNAFDNEIESKNKYLQEYSDVSKDFLSLESSVVKVNVAVGKMQKVYLITDEKLQELDRLQQILNANSKAKRRLEENVHGAIKTPYSKLVADVEELKKENNKTQNAFDDFNNYLSNLKPSSEAAYMQIKSTFVALKNAEYTERGFFNDEFINLNNSAFLDCYSLIDQIYGILKNLPIDVELINQLSAELKNKSNIIITKINDLDKARIQASDNITVINRDRGKFADVNAQLIQAEKMFNVCEYEKSLAMTEEIFKKLKNKSVNHDISR